MNKEIKITPPDGYEIDKENSTFEKIVFKEIKKELPKTWEDLGLVTGYYNHAYSHVEDIECDTCEENRNVFSTKEEAEASIALAQLSQLKKAYNGDWVADYDIFDQIKYTIEFYKNNITLAHYQNDNHFLSFKTPELRDEFLNNFRDLILKAKPLLG